ncbi:MAG: hypothetical protein AAF078_12515, partial [Planctomycetota bacterium]
IEGDWSFSTNLSHWWVSLTDEPIAHSEPPKVDMARACALLDGQAIQSVTVQPATGESRIEFDLGGLLVTRRYENPEDDTAEQWGLRCPDGQYFFYRSDGMMNLHPGDCRPGDERIKWYPAR